MMYGYDAEGWTAAGSQGSRISLDLVERERESALEHCDSHETELSIGKHNGSEERENSEQV